MENNNEKLIITIVKGMVNYLDDGGALEQKYNSYLESSDERDIYGKNKYKELGNMVYSNFPLPIGTPLRQFFSLEFGKLERFRKMMIVFDRVLKYVLYTMIAELWDMVRQKNITLSPEVQKTLADWFHASDSKGKLWEHIKVITKYYKESGMKHLDAIELHTIFTDSVKKKISALIEVRNYASDHKDNDLERIDFAGVENLFAEIMQKFSFVVKRKFVMIEKIAILKQKYENAAYQHNIKEFDTGQILKQNIDNYYENNAIVLIDNIYQKNEFYLNLSPLIIFINKEEKDDSSHGFQFLKKIIKGIGIFNKTASSNKLIYEIVKDKGTTVKIDDYNVSLFNKMKEDLLTTKTGEQ